MNDIITKSLKVPNLKEAWIKSVEPIKRMLEDRTSRLKLKEEPFVVHSAVNEVDVQGFERQVLECVDGDLKIGKYQPHVKSKIGTSNLFKILAFKI